MSSQAPDPAYKVKNFIYGTIKRQWGFSYIITNKYLHRASAGVGLIMSAYKPRRIINRAGIDLFRDYLNTHINRLFSTVRKKNYIIKSIRALRPLIQLIIRADAGFSNPDFFNLAENCMLEFCLGLGATKFKAWRYNHCHYSRFFPDSFPIDSRFDLFLC